MRSAFAWALGAAVVLLAACGAESSSAPTAFGGSTSFGFGGATSSVAGGFALGGSVGISFPLFDGEARRAERAVPLVGGTLIVTRDGRTAVASDPDRDQVSLVNLRDLKVTRIATNAGDVPGRLVEGQAGRIFVLAQATGELIGIDVASASVQTRSPICNAPRGIDYDVATDTVVVACRSGSVAFASGKDGVLQKKLRADEDLVDVVVDKDSSLWLLHRRGAQVSRLRTSGEIERAVPGDDFVLGSNGFRMRPLPSGEMLLSHASVASAGRLLTSGSGGTLVATTLSMLAERDPASSGAPSLPPEAAGKFSFDARVFMENAGPFDLSVSPSGERLALLSLGEVWGRDGRGSLYEVRIDAATGRVAEAFWSTPFSPRLATRVAGEPVAVAFDRSDRVIVQSREPAALVFDNGVMVSLSDASRADSSLALFYANGGVGYSCASCHPGGADDGRSWHHPGSELLVRTQSLEGGVLAQGPYFRAGDVSELGKAIQHMGELTWLSVGSPAQMTALGQWLQALPRPAAPDDLDEAAATRGAALFAGAGCATCHSGELSSDGLLHDVGSGGTFVTPQLVGLASRAPYFHDGCAETLLDSFGACGGEGHAITLSVPERADLVEFLRSL